jgi:hypothetical protein
MQLVDIAINIILRIMHVGNESYNFTYSTRKIHNSSPIIPNYAGQLTSKDLKTVRKAVWEARTKWMDIGLELDLSISDLTAIEAAYHIDIGRCFIEMLSLWLKQIDPPPTWTAMVAALQEPIIGYGDLAEQVESKYCNKTSDVTDSVPATKSQDGELH